MIRRALSAAAVSSAWPAKNTVAVSSKWTLTVSAARAGRSIPAAATATQAKPSAARLRAIADIKLSARLTQQHSIRTRRMDQFDCKLVNEVQISGTLWASIDRVSRAVRQ